MKFPRLFIGLTMTGRIRVYVWGQHDHHTSDWRGTNDRWMLVPGQGTRFQDMGFAASWARDQFADQAAVEAWARRAGNGQHLGSSHHLTKYLDWEIKLKDEADFAQMMQLCEKYTAQARERLEQKP